jgi:ribonuclease HI
MELLAAIKALAALPACTTVTIWTDSQYVMRGSAQFKKEDANADLWKLFDELKRTRTVSVRWVQAHSGHPDNERVDRVARKVARKALRGLK